MFKVPTIKKITSNMEVLCKGKFPEYPQIVLIHDFISDEEIDNIIEVSKKYQENPATCWSVVTGEDYVDASFRKGDMVIMEKSDCQHLIKEIFKYTGWGEDDMERPKMIHYGSDGYVNDHMDYSIINSERQRAGTFVTYIKEPISGGRTLYPELDIAITPRKGSSLFMNYSPHKTHKSTHASEKIIEGEKSIITSFLYGIEYRI